MKTTMHAFVYCLSLVASLLVARLCSPSPRVASAQGPLALESNPPDRQEQQEDEAVDDYVKAAMSRQHIPALSLVVIRDGKIIKAQGYGLASIELNVPAKPETVYELASTTKPLVATAIMMLVQDKKLDLEDKISKYLPDAPDSWKAVTIRHLLTHTSGIKCYLTDMRHDFPNDTSLDQFVQVVSKEPLKFAPGEKWSYSNTGFVLLGMIIQKVTGRTFDAFLDARVFEPLGMTATRHDSRDEIISNRAVGYLWAGPGGLRNCDFLKYLMMYQGDGGILSNVLDLAKFEAALSDDQFLTSSSRDAMWTQVKLNNGKTHDYGLGWFVDNVNGHKHIFHPGGSPGTAAMISRYPDDRLTIIFLTNGGATYAQALDLGIAQRYVPGLVSRKVIKLEPPVLDSCTGYYNAYGSQVLKVTRDKAVLALDDGGTLANDFLPLSDTEFVAEDADRGFTLSRAANGEVSGMTLRLGPDKMKVQRMGPLFSSAKVESDPNPELTQKVEAVLKAMAEGGDAVKKVANIAPGCRKDYSQGPAGELKGIKAVTFVSSQDVTGKGIVRHGGKVSQILYLNLSTNKAPSHILVYLTSDGLVTDQDVVGD
jgi:CubicO group peptidase (beta-lactamase class C family)